MHAFLAVIPFFVVFGFVASLAGRQESRQEGRQTDVQYRKIECREIKYRTIKYRKTNVQTSMYIVQKYIHWNKDTQTHRHTDGQTNIPTDRQIQRDRKLDSRQTGSKADRHADRKIDVQTEGQVDRHNLKYLTVLYSLAAIQAGKQAGRLVGRQEDRQAERQADKLAGGKEVQYSTVQKYRQQTDRTDRQEWQTDQQSDE